MKFLITAFLLTLFTFSAFGQNEQAPITEKSFAYKDWTYKNLEGEGETNLRKFTEGKKFVMVVYWAPWCPNWKHDVAFVQQLHEKYKDKGLTIIGVANYDSVEKMKAHVAQYKLTFPMVYDKTTYGDREKTVHFTQRREAFDNRKWGTPWYIFLEPGKLKNEGEALTEKTMVVNGELMKADAEKYIQEKLGIATFLSAKIEECDPMTKTLALKKP
jgi:Thiol-disulfide isomerase and thioredoxins